MCGERIAADVAIYLYMYIIYVQGDHKGDSGRNNNNNVKLVVRHLEKKSRTLLLIAIIESILMLRDYGSELEGRGSGEQHLKGTLRHKICLPVRTTNTG